MKKIKYLKRKFYDKWGYKVTLNLPGCYVFRNSPLEDIEKYLLSKGYFLRRYPQPEKKIEKLVSFRDFIQDVDKDLYNFRIERDRIDVYTNNKDLYEKISEKFEDELVHRFEPNPDVPLSENSTVYSKKLPHEKYQYKVYLKPHKLAGEKEEKTKYLNWIDTQSDKILISDTVKTWFIKTDWNWDRRYIWVEDDHTLLMLKLRNSEVCGKVYKYQVA